MTRMFVAVVPPEEVVADLDAFLSVRREAASFRWTDPAQWHLTLAFAATCPSAASTASTSCWPAWRAAARPGAAGRRRWRLPARRPGPCPLARLGLSDDDAAGLDLLAAGCRAAMSRAGARVDGQRFRPHVTLGRLGRPANVTSWVRLLDAYAGPTWLAGEITLVASHLGEGPRRRPRHEVVASYALG